MLLKKVNIHLLYLAVSLKRNKNVYLQKDLYTTKWLLTDKWYTHTIDCYSAIKMHKLGADMNHRGTYDMIMDMKFKKTKLICGKRNQKSGYLSSRWGQFTAKEQEKVLGAKESVLDLDWNGDFLGIYTYQYSRIVRLRSKA